MQTNYTEEENEILDFIENENPSSIKNLNFEIEQLKNSVKAKNFKRKYVKINILENDLEKIQSEALKSGIRYETLLGSIIHKYINSNLVK